MIKDRLVIVFVSRIFSWYTVFLIKKSVRYKSGFACFQSVLEYMNFSSYVVYCLFHNCGLVNLG